MSTDDASEIHFGDRMSDSENLMWIIEHDPQLRSTITMLTLLDGTPDRHRVQHRIERATRRIPRLRQRVVANAHSIAPPRWEVDPSFTLSYHLRYMGLGGEGTLSELIEIAEPIAMQSFDRARPLWEFTMVEGLAGGRSALIIKVHHSITDGVGGVQLMLETFSLEADADDGEMPAAPQARSVGQPERAADALRYEAERQRGYAKDGWTLLRQFRDDPLGTSRMTADVAASAARTLRPTLSPLSPLWSERSLNNRLDTYSLSVAQMRAAGATVDAKLNDIFVTGVCRAVYLYHERAGEGVDVLRMGMAISTRTESTNGGAGNQFTPARIEVPVAIEDPIEHIHAIRALVLENREEPALELTSQIAGVLTKLPKSILTNMLGMMLRGVDFLTSNVPGISVPAYLVGVPVTAQYPFGPVSGAALNVTLLSYCDQAFLGINADVASIDDTEAFKECLDEGFAPLLSLA
ncbi:MAG: DUF1298 domain-containing protein [Acidobacteria bacterium]|nr:DUF1298 domain-containing protein [Acidobacteriota bacterium]